MVSFQMGGGGCVVLRPPPSLGQPARLVAARLSRGVRRDTDIDVSAVVEELLAAVGRPTAPAEALLPNKLERDLVELLLVERAVGRRQPAAGADRGGQQGRAGLSMFAMHQRGAPDPLPAQQRALDL